MPGAPVGLKKRHAGSLQTEVEHVQVGDRGIKKPGAGVRGGGGGVQERRSYCEFGGVIDGSTAKLYLVLLQGPKFHTFLKVPVLFDGLGHTHQPQLI